MHCVEPTAVEEAKQKLFEMMAEIMNDIEYVRICEFLIDGIETPVVGIVHDDDGGYIFEPLFSLITPEVYEDMIPMKDHRPQMIGMRAPRSKN